MTNPTTEAAVSTENPWSFKADWRKALVMMRDHGCDESEEPEQDRAYWHQALTAFDAAFVASPYNECCRRLGRCICSDAKTLTPPPHPEAEKMEGIVEALHKIRLGPTGREDDFEDDGAWCAAIATAALSTIPVSPAGEGE